MKLRFILVEPKVPENIGAAARALKTMGHTSLYIVNPQCSLTHKALWVAHGSDEIVRNATLCKTLQEAITDSNFTITTTAKDRVVRKDPVKSHELSNFLKERRSPDETISIVFGREESGLTNEEISMCDISTLIPMKQSYPSLNLGQAVMIYAYELADLPAPTVTLEERRDNGESLKVLKEFISSILPALDIPREDALFGRIMERISLLPSSDIRLMLSIASKLNPKN